VAISEAEIDAARFSWEEGVRRLDTARSGNGALRERLVEATMTELRRRVGVRFMLADLAAAYRDASNWFEPLARDVAPGQPDMWNQAVVLDAAFGRYARLAGDAPGRGRR